MSTDITIALLPNNGCDGPTFLAIAKRLCERGLNFKFFLYEMVSGVWKENYREISPIHHVDELERLFKPTHQIQLQMGFVLRSGRTITISFHYTGKEFEGGGAYQESGPFYILVSLNDLARPLLEVGGIEVDDALNKPNLTAACIRDAEDLFFAACGIGADVEPSEQVRHGVMYADLGFLTMLGCSMVYHQTSLEFLTDYPRIFCCYNFGTNPVSALSTNLDLWRLEGIDAENVVPGRLNPDLYQEVFYPDGEHTIHFASDLDQSRVKRLKSQTANRIHEWFRRVDLSRWQIRYHELPHGSFALTTYPLFTLWRAYAEFYRDVNEGT
jgi:hypothetical protein